MTANSMKCQLPSQAGFTLLELMLVMAILVIISSIAIPIVGNVLDRQKLRGAAEEVRMAWDNARLKALRTGQTQVFQCQIDSGQYSIQPLLLHDDANNVGEGATLMVGATAVQTASTPMGAAATAADVQQFAPMSLDETISFVSCRVAGDNRAYSIAQSASSATLNLTNLGHTVLFYPDGTTSTAEVLLKNQRGEISGVQIRGLTGHSKVLGLTFASERGGP